jgi:hypothetical protein
MANQLKNRQDVETQVITRALKDASLKQQLLSSPSAAKAEYEKEFGQKLPADLQVKVLEENANTAYIVLPYVASTEGMTDEELEKTASGFNISLPCMFGSATIKDGINIS